ncbi:hypothetical protein CCR75_001115 [Bremia lactucae]|uniref:Uncharacterized protein n=1 Tax=Bremia lactucae TaxID=4779 RepID=A0A976FRC4_BRELC|nr:hypothetical protein CCR75_001115 [Bremia lactucae]
MSSLNSRRRSLSESYKLNHGATVHHETSVGSYLPHGVRHDNSNLAALEKCYKSEGFICTAQGVVFKCQKYQSRVNSLVALATTSSSSQSNVLLAKKALRYRKVVERHCLMV